VDQSPVDVAASSPRGRILPSLAPDEPRHRLLQDAPVSAADLDPPSRAPKRPSVRALKRLDQASKSPRNSGFSSAESAPLAERLSTASHQPSSVQPDEGAGVSPTDPTPAPSQVVGNFGDLALRAKAKRRNKMAISRDEVRAKPLPNDQRSAIGTDFPATLPSRVDDRSPQSRTDGGADSSGREKIDDALDGGVGAVIGGFEAAVGGVLRVWPVMEAAIGERSTQALVEEEKEQRHLDAFLREAVGVA